jgi:hypothetical protein
MSHRNTPRADLCKELGLACHDTLESQVKQAIQRGRLAGGEVVRISVEVASASGDQLAVFSSVGPIAPETADRDEAA